MEVGVVGDPAQVVHAAAEQHIRVEDVDRAVVDEEAELLGDEHLADAQGDRGLAALTAR